MNDMGHRKPTQEQSSGSGQSVTTSRQPYIIDPIASKRVCFYKSGDPQFSGLRMVINNRTFKTFDALLDSLSKKVPLPFGVRNITTPRGVHAVHTLDELEDGKSYICSDRRKVKPINLALANKKPPPWYHARPLSSRRRTLQLARLYPGRPKWKHDPGVVRTPKKLIVFRNGEPSVRHMVMLQKRTTPTFESLLDYVSELMQFPVVKLHTPDGGRVDGLPALILCSGIVVATGREAFRSANYNSKKTTAPTWLPGSRMAPNRKKRVTRKKKALSSGSKSRNFSSSSERYFVNQIHNSIAGSLCDYPSNPTGSVELETCHQLESVAETEGDTCLGDGVEGMESFLPPDDDIEKSFRVNQDGSMTVEMKVRLTIKEEETVHWTTTLSRSSVANQLSVASLAESEGGVLESENPTPTDSINRRNSKDDEDDHSPPDNGIASLGENEENEAKSQTDVVFPRRAPTPGPRRYRKQQALLESIKTAKPDEIQQNMVGSYSYIEDTGNGKVTEEYCMVRQCCSRPVPKPRAVGAVDIKNYNRDQSSLKTANMSEILQMEDGRDEVTETVLHIYEQQTCQENLNANSQFSVQGMYGLLYGRPATSDTAHHCSSCDFKTEQGRPSTASESISMWKTDGTSLSSELTSQSLKTGKVGRLPSQKHRVAKALKNPSSKPTRDKVAGKENSPSKAIKKSLRGSLKPKGRKKQSRQSTTPEKRQKQSNVDVPDHHKRAKTVFTSTASLKKIYGFRPKAVKSLLKKKQQATGKGFVKQINSDDIENPNKLSPVNEKNGSVNKSETSVPFERNLLNVSHSEEAQSKDPLKRRRSMHDESKVDSKSLNISESVSLPALNSSPSVINEYVEHWLEKAQPSPTLYTKDKTHNRNPRSELEGGISDVSDINCELIITEEEKTPASNSSSLERTSSPNVTLQRNPMENTALINTNSMEKTCQPIKPTVEQPTLPSRVFDLTPVASSPSYCVLSSPSSLASEDRPVALCQSLNDDPPPTDEKTKPSNQSNLKETPLFRNSSVRKTRLVSNLSLERKMSERKASVEKSALTSDPHSRNASLTLVEIKVANTPLFNDLSSEKMSLSTNTSVDKTPQSPIVLDMSSLASSPSYNLSSPPSSLASGSRSSISLSSDEAPSPTDHKLQDKSIKPPLVTSTQLNSSLSPKPSVKKRHLVSNISLEKTLSARKVSTEKSEVQRNPSTVNTQPQTVSPNNTSLDETTLPTSHGTKKKPATFKNVLPRKLSPYSQSLEIVSPPVKVKLAKTSLTKNHSLDNSVDQKTLLPRRKLQTTPSKSTPKASNASSEQTPALSCPLPEDCKQKLKDKNEVNKTTQEDSMIATEVESSTTAQILPPPLEQAEQPDMKPVLEKLCYSIQSIRQITQKKRRSCLEKSNSLPDFSSHVASTFGSSTKALLAFLSVMTLKEGISNLNMQEWNANSVSCAEALKMIETLREIASIENAEKLQSSLTDLQKSTSTHLLLSWRGFQELGDKTRSRSSTPNSSEHNLLLMPSSEEEICIEESSINELIKELDMPEKLKEELSALPVITELESDDREQSTEEMKDGQMNGNTTTVPQGDAANVNKDVCNKEPNVDVKSIIKRFLTIHQAKEVIESNVSQISDSLSKRQKHQYSENQSLKEDKTCLGDRQMFERTEDCPEKVETKNTEEHVNLHGHNFSGGKQSNSLVLHDNCEEKQVCPLEDQEKCKNLSSSYREQDKQHKQSNTEDNPSYIELKENCKELSVSSQDGLSSPEEYQLGSVEDNLEVEYNKIMEVSNGENPSTPEKDQSRDQSSEDEPDNRLGFSNCPGQKANEDVQDHISYPKEDQSNSRGEMPMVKCYEEEEDQLMSPQEDEKTQSPKRCSEQKISSEESLGGSEDEEEEEEEEEQEEQPEVNCVELHIIDESRVSSPEEKASSEEEQEVHMGDQFSQEEQEIKYSDLHLNSKKRQSTLEVLEDSFDEERGQSVDLGYADAQTYEEQDIQNKIQSTVIEKQSSLVQVSRIIKSEDTSLLRKQASTIEEHYSFDMNQDSGNEHVSCEEHADSAASVNFENKPCSLNETILYSEQRQSSSGDDHVSVEQDMDESYAEYQESYVEEVPSEEDTSLEMAEEKNGCVTNLKEKCNDKMKKEKTSCDLKDILVPSVAERVGQLEMKVAGLDQRRTVIVETPGIRRIAQIEVPIVSEADDLTNVSELSSEQSTIDDFIRGSSEMRKTSSALSTQSAPSSSLAFSYDSSGCLTRDSDGNRVKSIKEMFMAKSVADIQYRHRQLTSPNISDLSDSRPETSDSGGHQSQASPEVSSGEEESVLKSIAKGIVKRTIERLYGKKEDEIKDLDDERPPSSSTQRLRDNAIKRILSPFHMARSKVMSDLSYFNATNSFESYSEPTRCIAFNVQVRPEDGVPIDKDRWFLRENTLIRKSISEPIAIHKNSKSHAETEKECDNTKEDVPYSHFSVSTQEKDPSSELEDRVKPMVPKCTYFTLPHSSDSDPYQDEMSMASQSSAGGNLTKEEKNETEEEPKICIENNSKFPTITPTDFKMKKDNKVYPLVDGVIEGQVVVVVQPGKGQTAIKGQTAVKNQTAVNKRPQEPDALELLYVFCGQHCPVL